MAVTLVPGVNPFLTTLGGRLAGCAAGACTLYQEEKFRPCFLGFWLYHADADGPCQSGALGSSKIQDILTLFLDTKLGAGLYQTRAIRDMARGFWDQPG